MASAINILHQRRQRQVSFLNTCNTNFSYHFDTLLIKTNQWFEQEAEALATRFALVLSSRQPRDMVNYLSMEP